MHQKPTVLDLVMDERQYQINKWGNEFDDKNTPYNWMGYITHYASRNLAGDPNGVDLAKFRTDMIKVAAMAVAAVEAIDRKSQG